VNSEYKSSPFGTDDQNARILVDEFYTKLPADLQDPRGSLYFSYMAATSGETRSANYVDHATNNILAVLLLPDLPYARNYRQRL
jgi:hypothetical protein